MKKIKYLLAFILTFLLIGKVNAMSFTCDKENDIQQGDKISCTIDIAGYGDGEGEGPKLIINYKKLKIGEIVGTHTIKDNIITFSSNGKISFKSDDSAESYEINVTGDNYSKNISGKITTKTTASTTKPSSTTTTTTTKKKSDNAFLSSIKVNKKDITNFKKDVYEYEVNVDNTVTKATFDAKPEDELASVKLDGTTNLKAGKNEFTIKVVAEDESEKTYKITIVKDEDKSSNTKIKKIDIKGYDFSFSGTSKAEYLTLKNNETELDILVTLEDKKAKYDVSGNSNLKDGSIIKINVTAENGDKSEYRIIIEKKQKSNSKTPIIIVIIIVMLIAIGVIVYLLINNNKNNKMKKNNKDKKEENLDETKTFIKEAESSDEAVDNDEFEKTMMVFEKKEKDNTTFDEFYDDDFFL